MSSPVRVLHLCAGNLYGGVERIVAECARSRRLCPAMQPLFAVCFDGRLSRELDAEGVTCARLGAVRFSRPQTIWRARRALSRLLAAERPDVIVCHSSWIFAVAAPPARKGDARLALWIHDRVSGRPWTERWARLTDPDLIICNSHFTRASVPQLFGRVESRVVYAPVDPGQPLEPTAREALRRSLGVSPGETVILMASRFEEWKGHRLLVDALATARGAWRLWIAGSPQRPHEEDYLRSLHARVTSSGVGDRVTFLGERADVAALMRAADIHCQPNTAPEPFGLVFVEALYAGLPVVTTAMGGACEIVTDACGVLVPPHDPRALAVALERLTTDPADRRRLGAGGPVRARQLCDPASQLAMLSDAVHSALPQQAST